MTKAETKAFLQTIEKYNLAISTCLHPSQVELLYGALTYWNEVEEIPQIEDAFTNLAFMMIVSDLLHQEREKERAKGE